MDISIRQCIAGAKQARGVAVVIDVLRASNTIIACLMSGARDIRPVGALEEAYALKKSHPGHLLFGERKALPPPGFDGGNTPAAFAMMDLHDKHIIFTTSAGSQGIVNATGAEEIIIGSFANAAAVIGYIRRKNPSNVSLLAMGDEGLRPAVEDDECARYLKAVLEGAAVNFEEIKPKILASHGADRLRGIGREEDIAFCTRLDTTDIVPVVDRKSGVIRVGK